MNTASKLNHKKIDGVRLEVSETWTIEELNAFDSFEDFFNEVQVVNAYEADWNSFNYKDYFLAVYIEATNEEGLYIYFDPDCYCSKIPPLKLVDYDFFCLENGYSSEDLEEVKALQAGQAILLDNNQQLIFFK